MKHSKGRTLHRPTRTAALLALAALVPGISSAEIVWDGTFDSHSFKNYHVPENPNVVKFHLVPDYGRPPQYGKQDEKHVGNGELLSLVDSPTRGSRYAAKFTVKSSASGSEPADCDPATSCERRRSFLQMTSTLLDYYNAIPQGAERWVSFSVFVPSNFEGPGSVPGFGPIIWGSKSSIQNKPGAFGVEIDGNEWKVIHRFYSKEMHRQQVDANPSWWLTTEYSSSFPSASDWPQGLVDFPDEAASKKALGNLNKGGWTDFIWHFKTDIDQFEQNSGFLDVWMRADSGPWVHVIKARPMKDLARDPSWPETAPERVYDRGIGQYGPDGYTSQLGLYMSKSRVWSHRSDMTVYIDNHKVGDENATFADMSHDGSSPGPGSPDTDDREPPKPPVIVMN